MTNEQLVALIKKNPVSVGCGVLSLALAVGLYFRSGGIPEAEAVLAEKTAQSERYTLNLTNAAQLKEQHEELVAANKAIDARIIRLSQLGINTQFFYKLERETGVKLVDNRQTSVAAAAKGKTTFIPVAFAISAQGTLPQLLDFLRLLESGSHYSRVMTATLTGSPANRSGPLTLALTLELLGLP